MNVDIIRIRMDRNNRRESVKNTFRNSFSEFESSLL